jgi:nucleotide-binding universal stress UspA family protein
MKILVGYDGSASSNEALALAESRAKVLNAELHVITSFEQRADPGLQDIKQMDEARAKLKEVEEDLSGKGMSCKAQFVISSGTHGENIVRYIVDNNIDEVLIGIKKTSKVDKLVFGSTAQYVILKSPCPVTSVRAGFRRG